MAATELATAYVSLVPSLKGASGSIAKELGGIDLGGPGKNMGSSLSGGMLGSLKGLVGPAAAIMAGIGIGNYVKESFESLQGIEVLNAQTANVIKSTGGAAGVSADYVKDLALSLEGLTATEAQQIQSGANTLLTFTNIKNAAGAGNDIFSQATGIMVDYSRAMGIDAQGAAIQLGKALNDPTKGVSALGKAGVQFTAQQKEQIKTMQESGNILGAQKIILKELETQFGGSGAAFAQTTAGKIYLLKDAYGDLGETLVSSFMPAVGDAASVGTVLLSALNPVVAKVGETAAKFTSAIVDQGPRLSAAFGGIKALVMNGDITPELLNALGVEEDSPVISGLMWLQDKLWAAFTGIQNFIAGFTIPADSLSAQLNGAFSPAFAFGIKLQTVIQGALTGVKDFMAGFTLPMDWADPTPLEGMVAVGASVRDFFSQIGAAIGPLIPSVIQLWSSFSPLQLIFQSIQPFLPQLLSMFGQLASVVGGALVSAITGILPAIMTLQSVFVSLLQGVLAQVLPVVIQLITMLGATFTQLLPILIPIITQVVTLAATLVSQLAPIFMQLVSTVMPMVVTILGAVLAAIGPLISMIAGLLIPIIQALMPVVVTVFSVIASVIGSVMQIVMGIIQVVTGIISGNWAQVWNGIVNIFSGVWNLIVNLVRGALQIVGQVVISGLGLVGGFIGGALAGIGRFFADTWNNIVNGASGMIGGLLGFFGGLGGKILGALGNVGSTLFSAGKNIVQGLIDGIGSMLGAIGRAVINIVPEAIRGPFEQLMGIHSPSLVARGWGHHIGTGLVLGLEDEYDPIAEATALLVKPPALPSFASAGARAGYSGAGLYPATGGGGVEINQTVYPAEKMSEENLAEIAARRVIGALT